MKQFIIGLSLLITFTSSLKAQIYDKQCYYGISFEKSENRNWGYGELVITNVEPGSRAEQAGIRVNDIIMEINGKATYLRDNATISEWMFDNSDPVVKFTLRNIDTYFKEYTLNRECIAVNSVDEGYLANVFSFYSLEDTRQKKFTLPLRITPTPDVDYTDYHTFAFYNDGNENTKLDNKLQEILTQSLINMGLKYDENDPDIWISLYYEHVNNPHYVENLTSGLSVFSKRFNSETMKMENYPIYNIKDPYLISKGQYVVKLGIAFYEKKHINEGQFTQIWECDIQDYLSDNLTLEEYAQVHIPLITMQYPYASAKDECEYFVDFSKYYYTGIHFDAEKIGYVADVSLGSPAYKAGIRPGMMINKINGKKVEDTIDNLSEGYKKFITETEKYRDPSTTFVGVEGYKCKFWKPIYYPEIAKAFKENKYSTLFSYLYDFEEYVNPNSEGIVSFDVTTPQGRKVFIVHPEIKQSTVIKAL